MKQRNAPGPDPKPIGCDHSHPVRPPIVVDARSLERAAQLFRALGDRPRLQLLVSLSRGECCVGELVEQLGEKFSTISQRLRILRSEGLIQRRRAGLHVFYSLADGHVAQLLSNALDHAGELNATASSVGSSDTEDDE